MAFWIANDGSKIYYEWLGNDETKPPLLLLPGLLGTARAQWKRLGTALRQTHRPLLIDLRGHGMSDNRALRLELPEILADVIGLLEMLRSPKWHVAGYDLGGYLGLLLAQAKPNRVATLLTVATKFYWTDESVEWVQQQLQPDNIAQKAPKYATQLVEEHGATRWRPLVRQAHDLVAILAENSLQEANLQTIRCPVLICVGDRDELVRLPEAHRLSRLLPNSGLLTLPNTRHPFSSIQPVPLLPMMQVFHIDV